MQSCLGIAIGNKIIKYAKVEKANEKFNIVSYGIRFYDELELQSTIRQIVLETGSNNVPISINVRGEKYYYFDIFGMGNANYVKEAIDTEFGSFCTQNKLIENEYVGRSTYTQDIINTDQDKVIYTYVKKSDLAELYNQFSDVRLTTVVPMPTTIQNIARIEKGKNFLIVDLDDKTTITTIINQHVYNVDSLNTGLKEAIDRINTKENSYSKTYDVLKNMSIYTNAMSEANYNMPSSEYLQYVVPSLFKISQELQDIVRNYNRIDKIYLTGIGTVINNVDLYFQEYFQNSKVEILKPFFIEDDDSSKVNIKDYIEVNPAIALAIQGLGYGIDSLNFRENDILKSIRGFLNLDFSSAMDKIKKSFSNKKNSPKTESTQNSGKLNRLKGKIKVPKIDMNFSGSFDGTEIALMRDCIVILIAIIVFCVGSTMISKQIESKNQEVADILADTNQQINLANADDSKILQKTSDYQRYKTNLENTSSIIEVKRSRKNQITNLLLKLVDQIPKEVTLDSIKQTEQTQNGQTTEHIEIKAHSKKYEQLAYFKAKLKNTGTLDNVLSTEATKSGENISITISGDLKSY